MGLALLVYQATPPPGLAVVSQVKAISNTVMAQMSAMTAAFQAQISDLSAKVNLGSSSPIPVASSTVTELTARPEAIMPTGSSVVTKVTMVRPEARLAHSFVEATVSMVRQQPTGAESEGEVAPVGEYLSSSGLELAVTRSGPVSTVTRHLRALRLAVSAQLRTTPVILT